MMMISVTVLPGDGRLSQQVVLIASLLSPLHWRALAKALRSHSESSYSLGSPMYSAVRLYK